MEVALSCRSLEGVVSLSPVSRKPMISHTLLSVPVPVVALGIDDLAAEQTEEVGYAEVVAGGVAACFVC